MEKMKLSAAAWTGLGAICVSILGDICASTLSKWWDYLFSVDHLLKELGRNVQQLSEMPTLNVWDPISSSEERSGWLKGVKDLQEKQEGLKKWFDECRGLYYLWSRYHIGKKVKREIEKANDLIIQGKRLLAQEEKKIKDGITWYSASNVMRWYFSMETDTEVIKAKDQCIVRLDEVSSTFPGTEGSYLKVLHFIEDTRSVLMGIWGMPGVGKTALLRLVHNSCTGDGCFDGLFDHIMFVGAGTGCVVNNVQHAIAINMGLDWGMLSSLVADTRTVYIINYLKDKSFLLLLDDVREPLDLQDVGLPILSPIASPKRQKIVIATTSPYVCALMGCRPLNTIEMKHLGKDDAWKLFKGKVGHGIVDDDPEVHHLAQQMVLQCGGLPLALCALGRVMSNKKDPREWRSAYAEKVGTSILSPVYGQRGDSIVTAGKTQGNTSSVYRQKLATLPPREAKSSVNQTGPSSTKRRVYRGLATRMTPEKGRHASRA